MYKFVLLCKSYKNDIDRASVLVESVNRFNVDSIPFYMIVPKADIALFKSRNFNNVNLLEDEEVYDNISQRGWIQQQIVKSSFWKLKISENYLSIDSDNYFIRSFYLSDFMYDENTPYTLMHEQKDLFSWTVNKTNLLGFNPKNSFIADRMKVMEVFGRKGRVYDFGPGPVIWSSKVWKSLEDNYLTPNKLKFEDLITYVESEFTWYGESLLAFNAIPIYPVEPMFKFFHYKQQLEDYHLQGYTKEMIAENYMGIVLQSNWGSNLRY